MQINDLQLSSLELGDGRAQALALFLRYDGEKSFGEIRRLAVQDGIPAEDILRGNLCFCFADILADGTKHMSHEDKRILVHFMIDYIRDEFKICGLNFLKGDEL